MLRKEVLPLMCGFGSRGAAFGREGKAALVKSGASVEDTFTLARAAVEDGPGPGPGVEVTEDEDHGVERWGCRKAGTFATFSDFTFCEAGGRAGKRFAGI